MRIYCVHIPHLSYKTKICWRISYRPVQRLVNALIFAPVLNALEAI